MYVLLLSIDCFFLPDFSSFGATFGDVKVVNSDFSEILTRIPHDIFRYALLESWVHEGGPRSLVASRQQK